MGVRLEGPRLPINTKLDMISEGVVKGAIQVPGRGLPFVLLADHQPTGGYPKIATTISAHLDAFAQLRPRQSVRFRADVGHGTVKEMLSTGSLKELELLLVNIEPGGHSGQQTCSHDGEEMGLVAGQSIFTPHFGTQNIKEHRGAVLQEFIYDIYHICPCNKSDLKLECARAGESCF